MPLPISVFIITKNEADRVEPAIKSVRDLVDEVVVIDSGSTDGTVAVAERLGVRVLHNEWPGYGLQKRFGEDQCRNQWIINLDADERVTPELAAELMRLFAEGEPAQKMFRIDVKAACPHERNASRWAFANDPIRLYDRRFGRFSDNLVHDSVIPHTGVPVAKLRSHMLHYSVRSLTHVVGKINAYSTMQAEEYRGRKQGVSLLRMCYEFPVAFLKAYFLRRHCVWGMYGFVLSMTYAFSRFLRLAKIYEADLMEQHGCQYSEPIDETPGKRQAA